MKRILHTIIPVIFILLVSSCKPDAGTATPESEIMPTAEAIEETATAEPTPEPEPIVCNIVFESDRDENREIYTMAPDGSNVQNLTNDPADDFNPAWSPDGSQIAFVSNRAGEGEEGGQFIFIMNADGSDVHKLTPQNGSDYPVWSPSGEYVAYDNNENIYMIKADGSEDAIQITDSSEKKIKPDFSPDGDKLAYLSGSDFNWNITVINLETKQTQQLIDNGTASDVEWTVDGRLFTHIDHENCNNCVMDADGQNVIDAGGKGSIQEFIPFWTLEGDRVECVAGDVLTEDEEIYLVSDIYPDVFLNLTNNPANDRNPDWPANCGPAAVTDEEKTGNEPVHSDGITIGYEDTDRVMSDKDREGLLQACNELGVNCIQGNGIPELVDQNVDVIISASSKWRVMGAFPDMNNAVGSGVPIVVVNADSDLQGTYNVSVDANSVGKSMTWVLNTMGGNGDFVYFNFGSNSLYQGYIDNILKEYPNVNAISMPADYENNTVTDQSIGELVTSNPDIKGIWSTDFINNIFWGVHNSHPENNPAILCESTVEMLQNWKNMLDENPNFECYSEIKPGDMYYESVYAAFYIASGYEINPDALGGPFGNTFKYEYPVITNENLDEWIEKENTLQIGDGGQLNLPPMTPEEIKAKWFLDSKAQDQAVTEEDAATEEEEVYDGVILGYAGDNPDQSQRKQDFQNACDEMETVCIYGDIPDLMDQGVNAIVLNTNSKEVDKLASLIKQALSKDIPVFVLDAESDVQGAINITVDHELWVEQTLGWMMDKIGGKGQIAYFDLDPNYSYSDSINNILAKNPKVSVVEFRDGDYGIDKIKPESADYVKIYPELKAIWTSSHMNFVLQGLKESSGLAVNEWPVVLCEASLDGLDTWRSIKKDNPDFDCFALAQPPAVAFDAAYAAFFAANGSEVNEGALVGPYGNTFYVNMPIIFDQDLEAWFDRTKNESTSSDYLVDEIMGQEDIKANWFK